MKWSRVKWLLIVCLLAADCFLGIQLLRNYRSVYTVSREAQEDASALLASCGISVSPEVIPDAVVPDFVYRFDLSAGGTDAAGSHDNTGTEPIADLLAGTLAAFSGGNISARFLLPDSTGTSLAFSNGDSAVCYPNFYVSYTCAGTSDGQETVDAFLKSPGDFSLCTGRIASAAEDTASLFLERYTGIALSEGQNARSSRVRIRMRAHCDGVYSRGNTVIAVFSEEIGRGAYAAAVIEGTQVFVVMENNEVRYFCGTWMPFLPSGTYRVEKLGQLDILFAEKKRLGDGAERTVDSMERRYYMLWDDLDHVFLRPAWQIGYERESVICDAVNGSVMLQTYHEDADLSK